MQQLGFNREEVLLKEQIEVVVEDERVGYCFLKRTIDVVHWLAGLIG